jgi:MTH538 TIR-like domain (DUF1863)
MSGPLRFAAFISYSSKDAAFAGRLHKALESYEIPSALGTFDVVGGGKKNRIYPVFRDREELSAGDLGDRVEAALKASSALIVVCSPNSAASPWVQKEIDLFVSLGRRDRVFAIIHDRAPALDDTGADATPLCFPPAFRGDALRDETALEPLAADARRGKDGFRNAWLKIVAGLIGVDAGALHDRDRARQRGRRTLALSVISLLALAGAYAGAWVDARNWRADLSAYPEVVAAQGGAIDPAPFAIAGAGNPGLLVPGRGARSDDILVRVAPMRMQTLGDARYAISQDGRILVASAERAAAVYDRVSNTKIRDLAPFHGFSLSENGAALVTQDNTAAQTWTYYDLTRPGAPARSLGVNGRDIYGYVLSANGASLVVKNADNTATLYDLAHGGVARTLGQLGDLSGYINIVDWDISANGAAMATRMRDNSITLYDLASGARRRLAPLPAPADTSMRMFSLTSIAFSRNGAAVALSNADYVFIYEVSSGRVLLRSPAGSVRRVQLSDDGDTAILQLVVGGEGPNRIRGDTVNMVYDLATGAQPVSFDGGFRQADMSEDGGVVAAHGREGLVVLDRGRGGERTFETYGRFHLSATGRYLLVEGDPQDSGAYQLMGYDLEAGGPGVEIAQVTLDDRVTLSRASSVAAIVRENGDGLLVDMAQPGATRPIGVGLDSDGAFLPGDPDAAFVANDSVYVARRADQSVVIVDLRAPSPVLDGQGRARRGANLAASICAGNGDWLAPFASEVMSASAGGHTREAARVKAILAGRPWNPCDWRGLLSGPEGWAQWWRRVEVAVLGRTARDYQCGEINAAGAVSERRIDACRFSGVPEARIAGPDLPDPQAQ